MGYILVETAFGLHICILKNDLTEPQSPEEATREEAAEITQQKNAIMVECLLCKYKALGSNPIPTKKKSCWSLVAHDHILVMTQEAEIRRITV
jgi:hypothetical protein